MKIKSTFTVLSICLTLLFFLPTETLAQQQKKGPPSWAPAHGYRAKVRQIYFPDYKMYYDLQKGVYIYLNKNSWQISVNLPRILGRINLSSTPKVELELNTDSPQRYNAEHLVKYRGKGYKNKMKHKDKARK
ncbi:hypothetical protein [Gaetbulibacter aestuarii]|uniref:Uncharacterized protein n=1 Tax=Gaetbulibacter aestuarii TaxID=1502358 RepID=A0ABW7MZ52_9FLAO